jgi:O-6-methylguanine DNA methyltransferase
MPTNTQPKTLTISTYDAPLTRLLLVTDENGALRALDFEDYVPRMEMLMRRQYGEVEVREGEAPAAVVDALDRYFGGEIDALENVPWATAGTDFQQKVWSALCEIPAGETWSYGQLARHIGSPKAVRAVGLANGSNPVAIVVPCHRVIGADGTLTGYGGGLERKEWLLRHEGVIAPALV